MTALHIEIPAQGKSCGACPYRLADTMLGPVCRLFRDANGGGTVVLNDKRCVPCLVAEERCVDATTPK